MTFITNRQDECHLPSACKQGIVVILAKTQIPFKEEQMTAEIIDGKAIAKTIHGEIAAEVEAMKAQ